VSRPGPRVQACDRREATTRLRDARAQLDLATTANATDGAPERKAAASCAVLAGIAAADAACCAALRERSRSQNHRDASNLLRAIEPGGKEAAGHFERLINLKDQSQYGFEDLSGEKLTAAVRYATALVAFAESVLQR
jgi:hypothetical protein